MADEVYGMGKGYLKTLQNSSNKYEKELEKLEYIHMFLKAPITDGTLRRRSLQEINYEIGNEIVSKLLYGTGTQNL